MLHKHWPILDILAVAFADRGNSAASIECLICVNVSWELSSVSNAMFHVNVRCRYCYVSFTVSSV